MNYVQIAVVGAMVVGLVALLASALLLFWSLLSGRKNRPKRLRLCISSLLIMFASLTTAVAIYYFVAIPSVELAEYQLPFARLTSMLSILVPISVITAVGLLNWMILGNPRRYVALIALITFLAFIAASFTNWFLIYRIQVASVERYKLIDRAGWKTQIGDLSPDIQFTTLDGSTVRLSELRGKVVMVNFFATWCGPCIAEVPQLNRIWTDFSPYGDFYMAVIGREETKSSVEGYKQQHGCVFPVAFDDGSSAYRAFADGGIPRTYLISRDGRILFQTIGFDSNSDFYQGEFTSLRNHIQTALNK